MTDLSAYVGIPWSNDCTCWSGIVVAIYREHLGIDLPAYDTIPATDPRAVIPAVRRFFRGWQSIADGREKPMDVVLFDHGTHCGLVVGMNKMLHLEHGFDQRGQPFLSDITSYRAPAWASRIAGFYRLAA